MVKRLRPVSYTHLDVYKRQVLSAVVIVGYTIMGGFRAVSTTDLIQSVVMSMALIAVLVYGVNVACLLYTSSKTP